MSRGEWGRYSVVVPAVMVTVASAGKVRPHKVHDWFEDQQDHYLKGVRLLA